MVEENIKNKNISDEARQKSEAMKALRKSCKDRIDRVAERVKEQKKALKAINTKLADSPCTVPDIAEATGMPTNMVLWYIASMKKYGQIIEKEKDDGYFRYALQGEHYVND